MMISKRLSSLLVYLFLFSVSRSWKFLPKSPSISLQRSLAASANVAQRHDAKVTSYDSESGGQKSFFIETHGCQMNLADSDIVRSVMLSLNYTLSSELEDADLILVNTCAIREYAEAKVWQRLKYFESLRKKNRKTGLKPPDLPQIGVLGCMAERLKDKLFDDFKVNFIAGPDSYRQLPELIASGQNLTKYSGDQEDIRGLANTRLSYDETYADISPARLDEGKVHSFVTIMRGCDNHCAFCVVPYTRGRERSRPLPSILDEVKALTATDHVKEIVLLGQNVNSYYDKESASIFSGGAEHSIAKGFREKRRRRPPSSINSQSPSAVIDSPSTGVYFAELLHRVAEINPEVRVRFQSPHPKDFGDSVLQLIASTPNICKSLHMPAQHGNSQMLQRMQRGYSRESYMELVERAREVICGGEGGGKIDLHDKRSAGLGLSSDFIVGFCEETEEEFQDLLSLLRGVGFDQAFTYKYSLREQTYAGLHLQDNVPEDVKGRRLTELIDAFQLTASIRNNLLEIGRLHVVLVEDFTTNKRGEAQVMWTGRTDTNKRVVFPDQVILQDLEEAEARQFVPRPLDTRMVVEKLVQERRTRNRDVVLANERGRGAEGIRLATISKGDYVIVQIISAKGHTLRASPIARTTLQGSAQLNLLSLF